jgi:hypothetical protein
MMIGLYSVLESPIQPYFDFGPLKIRGIMIGIMMSKELKGSEAEPSEPAQRVVFPNSLTCL